MRIRIEGSDLPGARPGAQADALRLGEVHVGVQRKASAAGPAEVVSLVPASAPAAVWELTVTVRDAGEGLLDVAGPWVHGGPGARFLYLSWGAVSADGFAQFRRAKLLFGDVPGEALRGAAAGAGVLVGRLGLTDADGGPRCARVRPPAIVWTLE